MHAILNKLRRAGPGSRFLPGTLLVAMAVAGCRESPAAPEPDPGPVTIATTYSATGARATSGTQMVTGYRIAVDMLNEAGGIGGREVRLLTRDDGSSPSAAARHYFDFITTDSIDAILSPYSSPITGPVMEVTEAAGWPMVASLASAPDLWIGRDRRWTVQMLGPATLQHRGAIEIAAQYGARTVALVYENTTFAAALARGVRIHAREQGLEVVLDQSYSLGGADHEALMAAARDAGADMMAGATYFPDAVAFARAIKATGYTPMLVAMRVGAEDPLFLEELGDGARCIVGSAPWVPSIRTSGYITDSNTLVQRYQAEHGAPPNYSVAAAFGAVEILAEAMSGAMTADGEIDRVALRDRLFAHDSGSLLGPFAVSGLGREDAGSQLALAGVQVQWQDDGAGGLVQRIIHPPEVAEAEPCFLRGPEPITIVATYSATGPRSKSANEMAAGYRMAVEMLNDRGGIGGTPVRLVTRDDGSDPATAARHYAEFLASDSVDAILGPYSSPITAAVMDLTEAAGWPLIAPLAAAPDLWSGRDRRWSVQMLVPAVSFHRGAIELAAENGARTVALVYEDTSFPAAMARGVRAAAEAHGLEVVLDRSFPIGRADHVALVSAARDAGADVFAGGAYFPDAVALAKAVAETGYAPMLVSLNLGPDDPGFGDRVGEVARCMIGNAAWLPRMRTSGFIADSETVVRRYEAEHGALPNYTVAAGFGAVELFAEAAEKALDANRGIDRAAMRDHLFAKSTGTVLGPFAVLPLGHEEAGAQRALAGVQVQWQDDGAGGLTQRIVHPPEAAEAEACFGR